MSLTLGLLVVTHGRVAEELVQTVCTIVGDREGLRALSIGWDVDVEDASRRIEDAIRELDRGQGVLVLTDMFGGTPTNLAVSQHEHGKIEIVTGVNLPMLIKFTNLGDDVGLHEAAGEIAAQGRQAIHVASHLLKGNEEQAAGEPG